MYLLHRVLTLSVVNEGEDALNNLLWFWLVLNPVSFTLKT